MKRLVLTLFALSSLSACVETTTSPGTASSMGRGALAWEAGHPERAIWSTRLRERLGQNIGTLETASDMGEYCPNFNALSRSQKVDVWATMMVAIAQASSGFDAQLVTPTTSKDRVGLYQLSYAEKPPRKNCLEDQARDTMKEPGNAIDCAVLRASSAVKKDGVVAAGGEKGVPAKGLARVFQVMRISNPAKEKVRAAVRANPVCGS